MTLVATQSTSWLEEESSATAGKWGYLALKSNKGTVGGIIDDTAGPCALTLRTRRLPANS